MSNRGFYHNPNPNVSGLTKKVEVSVGQVTPIIGLAARHPAEDPGAGVSPATLGVTIPFDLYTHCGIGEIKAFGKYFERVGGTLGDGFGNPPNGWGNPYDAGTLSVVGNSAVFRDSRGHEVNFKLRPKATGFSAICS